MANQTSKRPFMVGNIRISDLNGFEDTVKNGIRGCFIPYDQNPTLFIGQNKQTGVLTVDIDILVREVNNSKSGSSHFIKLNVGKVNRERYRLSQEAVDSLKIVGNMYTRVPGQKNQGYQTQQQIAAPAGYQQQCYQPASGGYQPQGGVQNGYQAPAQQPYPQMPQAAGW